MFFTLRFYLNLSLINTLNISCQIITFINLQKIADFKIGKIPQMKRLDVTFTILILFPCGATRDQTSSAKLHLPIN